MSLRPERRNTRVVSSHPYLELREHEVGFPGEASHLVFTVELTEWVSIAAFTDAGEIVLVEQFRHGIDDLTLETPGGIVDAGEEPAAAALRELHEESGYLAKEAVSLGWVHPNPALSSNKLHMFLATHAVPDRDPVYEGIERTQARLLAADDVRRAMEDGRVTHALVILTLMRALAAR